MEQLHRHFFPKVDTILVKIKVGVQVKGFSRDGVCKQVVKYFEIFPIPFYLLPGFFCKLLIFNIICNLL